MKILTYLRRLQSRNTASPLAGAEIKKEESQEHATPSDFCFSLCTCSFFLQADFSVPQSTGQNMAAPLEFDVVAGSKWRLTFFQS